MSIITILYPAKKESRFDGDYYLSNHMLLVRKAWGDMGLEEAQVVLGRPGPDGSPPPYHAITNLIFVDTEAMNRCLSSEPAAEVNGDIANFFDSAPTVQFGVLA